MVQCVVWLSQATPDQIVYNHISQNLFMGADQKFYPCSSTTLHQTHNLNYICECFVLQAQTHNNLNELIMVKLKVAKKINN